MAIPIKVGVSTTRDFLGAWWLLPPVCWTKAAEMTHDAFFPDAMCEGLGIFRVRRVALYWACAWAANVRTRARDAEALAARDAGHGRERGRAQGKRGVCHELQPSGFLEHRRCSPSIDSYCIDSYSLARGVPRHVLTCTAVNEIKKHPPLTLAISGSTWGHVGYEARAGGTDIVCVDDGRV